MIALAFTFAFAALATLAAIGAPFPNNFDELAHLSAIAHIRLLGLPDLGDMRMLAPDLVPGFTARGNYLNHPPAYYAALAPLLPPDGWPSMGTMLVLRCVNVALSTLAVGVVMAVAVTRALPARIMIAYGCMVLFIPVLPYLGGGISNDNLGFLGGALCVLGAQLLQSRGKSPTGWALLAGGSALAALAKFTAGLMTGVFVVVFLLARWRNKSAYHRAWRADLPWVAGLGVIQALTCLPYAGYLLRHGSPAPRSPAFTEEYARIADLGTHLRGWVPGADLSLPEYAGAFLHWLVSNWNPVMSMTGWAQAVVLAGPVLVLALAAAGIAASLSPRGQPDPVVAAGGIALAVILPLHLVFSYRLYQETGSPPMDAVPRYYFPLALTIIPLAAALTLRRLPVALALIIPAALALALPVIAHCAGGGCP